jgi:Domain of unknown function (DUF4340)
MNRRNEILVVALVVQLVLILLITTLRAPASAASSKPLFDGVKASDVQHITVQDTGGSKIELAQKNGAWVLPANDDFPANGAKVATFIDKILKVQSGQLIARTSSSYERLKVADGNYAQRVDLQMSDGKSRTLLIGSSAGGSSVYVRAGGAAEVWSTEALNSTDASVSAVGWITSTLFTIQPGQLSGMTIANSNGTFSFTNMNNAWVLKGLSMGENLDQTKLTDMLSRISTLDITSPLGKTAKPVYGLQSPSATITLTLQQSAASSKPIVVYVGVKNSTDNTYSVFTTESPYYVQVSGYSLDDFVTNSRKDFLIVPTAVPTNTVNGTVTPAPTELPGPTMTVTPTVTAGATATGPSATAVFTITSTPGQ